MASVCLDHNILLYDALCEEKTTFMVLFFDDFSFIIIYIQICHIKMHYIKFEQDFEFVPYRKHHVTTKDGHVKKNYCININLKY